MTNARLGRDRTALILNGWIHRGKAAYIQLFETQGDRAQPLSTVVQAAQLATSRALGGGAWATARSRYGVVGQLGTLGISQTSKGTWVVRRWMMLAMEAALSEVEIRAMTSGMLARWERSIARSGDGLSGRASRLRSIDSPEVSALAETLVDCESAFDQPSEPFATSIRLEFGLDMNDVSAAELARRYRLNSAPLALEYAGAGRADELTIRARSFGFKSNTRGFVSIDVPASSHDFMEYALALMNVKTWSAYKASSVDPSASSWNDLVDRARELRPTYLDV